MQRRQWLWSTLCITTLLYTYCFQGRYLLEKPLLKMQSSENTDNSAEEPLLLRTARGEATERTPVWMMRQAGRHMKAYRELCKEHTSFRARSETVDIATEISLQPWRQYGTDGCILFSDILTPLEGMGVKFDILERIGPVLQPLTSISEIDKCMSGSFDPYTSTPFIREILQNLRHEVKNTAAVLGFIGLPYTLATYIVEGGSSKEFKGIKTMGYNNPKTLHHLLNILSDNIANYALYQIESGAQIIQVFDSWAGNLSPYDYDTFAKPYQSKVIEQIKKKYPDVPIIIYINKSGALIERMASVGADIVSLDWTVSIQTGKSRIGKAVGIQGNLDPMALFGSKESIKAQTETILREGGGQNHIMNLGHGIDAETPEENAQYFVDVVKKFRHEKQ